MMSMNGFKTLGQLTEALVEHGDAPALLAMRKDAAESWSYAALADRTARLAGGLRKLGIDRGENVALLAENSPQWIGLCLGLIHAGAVPTPIDVQMPRKALRHVLHDSATRFVATTQDQLHRLDELELERGVTPILLDAETSETPHWRALVEAGPIRGEEADPEDVAMLFYTSGTTGPPKGVPLTHRNLTFQLNAVRATNLVEAGDRLLLPLPLHHVYPYVLGLLAPLSEGKPIVLPRSLTGPQIVRAMREGEVTVMIGVPRLYRALMSGVRSRVASRGRIAAGGFRAAKGTSTLLRKRWGVQTGSKLLNPLRRRFAPYLRMVTSGGSPLSEDLAWELEGMGWSVITGYGLTETSPLLTWNLPGESKFASAGRPVEGVELRIDADAAPEGTEPPEPGVKVGEVLARGPGVFKGYRNLPEKTKEELTDDGWFRTGDLGYIDDDGFLHVMGRVSTMIVTESGENVQPDELEEAYAEHPAIREVGVLEDDGELVALVVPARRGEREEVERAVRQAIDETAKRLASYQRLSGYEITHEPIPRTRLGKVRRHELEQRYEQARKGEEPEAGQRGPIAIEQMSAQDRSLLSDPAAKQVWDWLVEHHPDEPLTPDSSPQLDLGIDSMAWLDLTLEIGERAGVEIDEEAMERVETVRDLLEEVAGASAGAQAAPLDDPEATLSDEQKQWLEPVSGANAAIASGMFGLNRGLMRSMFRVSVAGADRLPDRPPFVLASNHVSLLDPFVIAAALPDELRRRTYWGGWTGKTMRNALTRWVSRLAQTVPVDPKRAAVSSLAFGAAILKRGEGLVWFPEGQRAEDGQLQPFREGLGRLLERHPVPVIPVAIAGTHEAMPPGKSVPKPGRVSIAFGEPVKPEELEREGEGDEPADRMMRALRQRVAALMEETAAARRQEGGE